MERLLQARGGALTEGEAMLAFVQLLLALQHVHAKVWRALGWAGGGGEGGHACMARARCRQATACVPSSFLAPSRTQGILHRDVKPQNVFCSRHGIFKLGDFGIAKVMAPGKLHARTMVGTPCYMSPELVEDKVGWAQL